MNDLPRFRPSKRAYVLAVAAVLGVGVGTFRFWTNRNDVSVPTAATVVRTDKAAEVVRTAEPLPPPASAEVTEAQNAAATNGADQNAASAPRSLESARAGRAVSRRLYPKEVARRAPPSSEPKAEPPPPVGDSTARQAVVAPGVSGETRTDDAEGEDLRRLKSRRDRKLDPEDPFQ